MSTPRSASRTTSHGLNAANKTASPKPSPSIANQTLRKSQEVEAKPRHSPHLEHNGSSRLSSQQPSSHGTPKSGSDQAVGGSTVAKQDAGKPANGSRSPSERTRPHSPAKFLHKPDVTEAACETFEILEACTYVNKYIGTTEAALECECRPAWDSSRQMNHACDDSSDCINRAMKIECPLEDCTCGSDCQNQRIARAQYADVSVIQADRKGHGLRVNTALPTGAFVYEYIGEVIGQNQFQRRLEQYDHERIKHFYFMSLSKDEFIDATRKGNLGRFCNHSCNPNCYVEKWVVDDRLRMGIFAQRDIEAGEELTFNYNVDRYGADPQSCYCGEPNCVGVIGGKTQTNRGPALPMDTIEALGIEDAEDWDLAVAKKGRSKRKTGEIDEEYVGNVPSKSLSEDVVAKVLTTLRQNKERWIAKKLLDRLQGAEDEQIRSRIVRMHGYQILKSALSTWIEDKDIVMQIFKILRNLPMLTRNKIQKSGIEEVMQTLSSTADAEVALQATQLMEIWGKLEVAYRIQKRDPALKLAEESADRELWRRSRDEERAKQRRRSASPPKGPAQVNAPSGPRSSQKPGFRRGRGNYRGGLNTGPQPYPGWEPRVDNRTGMHYWYHAKADMSTSQFPTGPPPKDLPPTAEEWRRRNRETVEQIIREGEEMERLKRQKAAEMAAAKAAAASLPQGSGPPGARGSGSPSHKSNGHSMSEEGRKRTYETLISPTVMSVMEKYRSGLGSKEDAKRLAKQIGKKITASDFKKNRIDVKELDTDRVSSIKKALEAFFKAAVEKKKLHDKAKEARRSSGTPKTTESPKALEVPADEARSTGQSSGSERKRKIDVDDTPSTSVSPGNGDGSETKRRRVS